MTETLITYIEAVAFDAPVWGFALIVFFMTIGSSFIPFPSEVVMISNRIMKGRAVPATVPR